MGTSNGVSDTVGKLTSHKTGGSAHSTQQCGTTDIRETFNPPYMAETCGGDDDNAALIGIDWKPNARFVTC
jgi:hypothetical protein